MKESRRGFLQMIPVWLAAISLVPACESSRQQFIDSKTPGEWLTRDTQHIVVTRDPKGESNVEALNVRSSPDMTGSNLRGGVVGQIRVGARLVSVGQVKGQVNIGINPYERPSEVFFAVEREALTRAGAVFYSEPKQQTYFLNERYVKIEAQ